MLRQCQVKEKKEAFITRNAESGKTEESEGEKWQELGPSLGKRKNHCLHKTQQSVDTLLLRLSSDKGHQFMQSGLYQLQKAAFWNRSGETRCLRKPLKVKKNHEQFHLKFPTW